ncbi:hypothetical protein O1L60_04775 [Streptomyces diastatochromogenes]|nr:hypothetical protein [Streptomyces diastatochromogenes]
MSTPAVLRLARSSLRAHRRRFLGTFAAVLLGVAFLTGTLVMGDTLRASFDSMFTSATRGTDAIVRSSVTVTAAGEAQGSRGPVDAALAERLAEVPGSPPPRPGSRARASCSPPTAPRRRQGPPTLAGNWIEDPALNPYRLAEGRAPRAPAR